MWLTLNTFATSGSWWFASFLTATNGKQFVFITNPLFGLQTRAGLLDLSTLEYVSSGELTPLTTVSPVGLAVSTSRFSLTSDVPDTFSRMYVQASVAAADDATKDAAKVNLTLTPQWPILYNMVLIVLLGAFSLSFFFLFFFCGSDAHHCMVFFFLGFGTIAASWDWNERPTFCTSNSY
jgi:hypothetical protein